VMQHQVGDDARGDGHQQHVAAIIAHPVVAMRRAAQVVGRIILDHVDRAAVIVAVALATRPGMRRRAGAVVHDPAIRLGTVGVAIALAVAGAVMRAVVAAVVLAALVATAVIAVTMVGAAVVATIPAVAAAGGLGRRYGCTEADQGGDGQGDQLWAHARLPAVGDSPILPNPPEWIPRETGYSLGDRKS